VFFGLHERKESKPSMTLWFFFRAAAPPSPPRACSAAAS
jgi:hypothetical protein